MQVISSQVFAATESDIAKLKQVMEDVTKFYQDSPDTSKSFQKAYEGFKEATQYFVQKKGSTRVATLNTVVEGHRTGWHFMVKTQDGDVVRNTVMLGVVRGKIAETV